MSFLAFWGIFTTFGLPVIGIGMGLIIIYVLARRRKE
jgi:hypothetical protein